MIGYRNAVYLPQEECVRVFTWDERGNRAKFDAPYSPYVMIEDPKGNEVSIFNTKLRTRKFKTQYDRSKFIKECGTRRLFENLNPVQQFLVDAYWKHNAGADFGKFAVRIITIDIEVDTAKYKAEKKIKIRKKT